MTTRTCDFCSTDYDASAAACPKCAYPADGRFDAERPARPKKARRPKPPQPQETCRNCGGSFAAGRPACPHCGADPDTGWKSDDELDEAAVAIPEYDADDYERTLREAKPSDMRLWTSRQWRMLVIGLILVASMIVPAIVMFLRSR